MARCLIIGPVVGVHGDDLLDALVGWTVALHGWARREGLSREEMHAAATYRAPVAGAAAVGRLHRYGLGEADVEELRREVARLT